MKDYIKKIKCKTCGKTIEKMSLNGQIFYHERVGDILGFPTYDHHTCEEIE